MKNMIIILAVMGIGESDIILIVEKDGKERKALRKFSLLTFFFEGK